MSNKLVILLGAEDIYNCRTSLDIQQDYEKLLELLGTKFAYATESITLCTIPPLGNTNWLDQPCQFSTLRALNSFIIDLADTQGYQLVDFFSHFSNIRGSPKYELFQVKPRRVSTRASISNAPHQQGLPKCSSLVTVK